MRFALVLLLAGLACAQAPMRREIELEGQNEELRREVMRLRAQNQANEAAARRALSSAGSTVAEKVGAVADSAADKVTGMVTARVDTKATDVIAAQKTQLDTAKEETIRARNANAYTLYGIIAGQVSLLLGVIIQGVIASKRDRNNRSWLETTTGKQTEEFHLHREEVRKTLGQISAVINHEAAPTGDWKTAR